MRRDFYLKPLLLLGLWLLLPLSLGAIPARPDVYIYSQPDGTEFQAKTFGDDFFHGSMTPDGRYILQDEDGWWYYAHFGDAGRLVSTGVKVGKGGGLLLTPSSTFTGSSALPASLQAQIYQKKTVFAQMASQVVPLEKRKSLVILASFSDTLFRYNRSDFVNLLTQENYDKDGATGCALDYFNAQFNGKLSFQFDVAGPYVLPYSQAYYGSNSEGTGVDLRPVDMIIHACQAADNDVDFSQYDEDGDGVIDNVFVFYAGQNEAGGGGDNTIWPHSWYVKSGAQKTHYFDNVLLNRYACTSELRRVSYTSKMASIGVFCHEFSHTLGLMDYYDTDYAPPQGYCGTGCWCRTALMDGGDSNNQGCTPPYYNALDRYTLSHYFGTPELLTEGDYELSPLSAGGKIYYLPTDVEGEIFLFECRDNSSWDAHISGSGLLIYHLDKSTEPMGKSETYGRVLTAQERWMYNEVNAHEDYQCGYIVPAKETIPTKLQREYYFSYSPVSLSLIPYVFFPTGASEFTNNSRFFYRSGQASPYSLTNIRQVGSNVAFTVVQSRVAPKPTSINYLAMQDCAILSWSMPDETEAKAYVKYTQGGETLVHEVQAYAPGKYAYRMGGLTPMAFYQVQIYSELDGVAGSPVEVKFNTMSSRVGDGNPCICLKNVQRNEDQSFTPLSAFPLELYNDSESVSVEWYYDGQEVSVDGSFYFVPQTSGLLKAVVHYEDGQTQCIYKKVNIK